MEMHSPTTRGEVDNGMYKPITDGMSGNRQQTPNLATVQSAGSDELMWLLLERLLDFSVQCRQTQTMYTQGNQNPVLQELVSLLRMNGGGAFGNTSYGGGYNNSFLVDKISYLITKLDQQQHDYMNQNAPQLPSTGPVLEILFQMLRNQTPPSAPKNQQEYPEHIQKHLKVLGDMMMKMNHLPAEGQNIDLLTTLLASELETNPQVNNKMIQAKDKDKWVGYHKGAYDIIAVYNPGGTEGLSLKQDQGDYVARPKMPFAMNSKEEKDGSDLEKLDKELQETITRNAMRYIRKGYSSFENGDYRRALSEFKLGRDSIVKAGFNDDEAVYKLEERCNEFIKKCNDILTRKKKRSGLLPW